MGRAAVAFPNGGARDASFHALPRFARVYAGPLWDWSARRDTQVMRKELLVHLGRFGKIRSCQIVNPPRKGAGRPPAPFALLECYPSAARGILTAGPQRMATHRGAFN